MNNIRKQYPRLNGKLLKDYYPEFIKDWDYKKNEGRDVNLITIGSSRFLVHWKCHKCGYEWSQKVINRVTHNTKCKKCTSEENSFALKYPELMKDWDWNDNKDLNPSMLTSGSCFNIHWKCKECGNKWEQPLYVRIKLKSKCKLCENKDKLFVNTHPELLEEWDYKKNEGINPNHLTNRSGIKVWWICKKCGSSFKANLISRTKDNSNCRKCWKRIQTKVSIENTHSHLLKEWDFVKNDKLDISKITYGSNLKAWWICNNGHSYEAMIAKRTLREQGCPYCRGLKVDDSNSLLSKRADICEEWDYESNELSPNEVPVSSNLNVWWKCKNGHSFQAMVNNRTKKKGTKCPYCVGRSANGDNNFGVLYEEMVKEWNYEKNLGIDPFKLRINSNKKVWWVCSEGHNWLSEIGTRVRYDTGCPYCSGRLTPLEKSIGYTKPKYLEEWDYEKNINLDPFTVSEGSEHKVWWKCKENESHIWKTAVAHRTEGTGCPYCSFTNMVFNRYINRTKVSENDSIILYRIIIYNKQECFYKIGITKDSVAKRYNYLFSSVGYKIVIVETLYDNLKTIIEIEQTTHRKSSRNLDTNLIKYKPLQYFAGISECYILPEKYKSISTKLIEGYEINKEIIFLEELK